MISCLLQTLATFESLNLEEEQRSFILTFYCPWINEIWDNWGECIYALVNSWSVFIYLLVLLNLNPSKMHKCEYKHEVLQISTQLLKNDLSFLKTRKLPDCDCTLFHDKQLTLFLLNAQLPCKQRVDLFWPMQQIYRVWRESYMLYDLDLPFPTNSSVSLNIVQKAVDTPLPPLF